MRNDVVTVIHGVVLSFLASFLCDKHVQGGGPCHLQHVQKLDCVQPKKVCLTLCRTCIRHVSETRKRSF